MIYTGINLMLPTRRRPDRLLKFIKSALETSHLYQKNNKRIVFTLMVDFDDDVTNKLLLEKELIDLRVEGILDIIINYSTNKPHLGLFFNRLYEETKYQDPSYLVTMFGDDMVFLTQGWDKDALEIANKTDGMAIIYCDDDYMQHENLCVHLITSRKVVSKTEKSFMCSLFPVDFIDVVWMKVGQKTGLLKYMKQHKIRHEHNGSLSLDQYDDTFKRMRSTFKNITQQDIDAIENYVNEIVVKLS